jgi:gluconate 2-dehydrogenase gamma chain
MKSIRNTSSSPVNPSSVKFLTRRETRILEAVADRIFPATDTPGAVEAGAVNYIKQALAGDYAPFLRLYRSGLKALDRHARRRFGADFSVLEDAQKDAILLDFEAAQVPDCKKAGEFFETVRCHVLEGVFGEPDYGGNRDLIGWRLVGFPGQQFGYARAYINERVDIAPATAAPSRGEKE